MLAKRTPNNNLKTPNNAASPNRKATQESHCSGLCSQQLATLRKHSWQVSKELKTQAATATAGSKNIKTNNYSLSANNITTVCLTRISSFCNNCAEEMGELINRETL